MAGSSRQHDPSAAYAPLLASLAGVVAAMLLGVPLELRRYQPWERTERAMAVRDIAPAVFAPPPHGGLGQIVRTRCEFTGRGFLLYKPRDVSRKRSYPLVVWLAASQPDALAANDLARRWGESADRDRYFVLMPELSADDEANARDLPRMLEGVRRHWHIDAGPALLAWREDIEDRGLWLRQRTTEQAIRQASMPAIIGPHSESQFAFHRVSSPEGVPAVLADERLWPTLVQIRVRQEAGDPVVVSLLPIVAARLGPVARRDRDAYQWDLSAFDLPPSRLKEQWLPLDKPGDCRVSVRVLMESGRQAVGETTLETPPTRPDAPQRQTPD